MSAGCDTLSMKEDDVKKLLAAGAHLGDPNIDFQMKQYVYKVKQDGEEKCVAVDAFVRLCNLHAHEGMINGLRAWFRIPQGNMLDHVRWVFHLMSQEFKV